MRSSQPSSPLFPRQRQNVAVYCLRDRLHGRSDHLYAEISDIERQFLGRNVHRDIAPPVKLDGRAALFYVLRADLPVKFFAMNFAGLRIVMVSPTFANSGE